MGAIGLPIKEGIRHSFLYLWLLPHEDTTFLPSRGGTIEAILKMDYHHISTPAGALIQDLQPLRLPTSITVNNESLLSEWPNL